MSAHVTEKVVAYITHRDRLLVFRHTAFPEAGIQVPAGTVKTGEPPATAVLREAYEETGLERLTLRSLLAVQDYDLAEIGLEGIHRRHYFHLEATGPVPERWLHAENDPSDGSQAPIEFKLFWVTRPHAVPPLAGRQGDFLHRLPDDTGRMADKGQEDRRPEIDCIPMSTDVGKIRLFGTLMPALLLIKASPGRFFHYQVEKRTTPRAEVPAFIATEADDAARAGDTLLFVHRWHTLDFDSFAFARAKSFLARLARLVRRAGFWAEPLDPLSPFENLPKLAAAAGLGNLSPYGLLVHPIFGPRLILTGLRTDYYPLTLAPRWGGGGCDDCLACVKLCPQEPALTGTVHLAQCQSCARCLSVCPTGKGRRARAIINTLPT